MKRERLRTVLFLTIILIITLFVRIFFLNENMASVLMEGDYYQKAVVGSQGSYRVQKLSVDELYTKALSYALLIFGNFERAGVYLNIFLQTAAVAALYFAIRFVANTYAAFGVVTVISVIPFYSDKIFEISAFNLWMLIYAVGLFILAIISKKVYLLVIKTKTIEKEQDDMLENKTGVITLDDIIGDSNYSSQTTVRQEELMTEKEDKEKDNEQNNEQEAEALPSGMKEIILDENEKKKKVKFIENPLPVPKRREHRGMDYTVELRADNDDYDIKDVSGMDFFDIE